MKRCPNCGNTEPSSARFCTSCGCQLEETRENPFRDPNEEWNNLGNLASGGNQGQGGQTGYQGQGYGGPAVAQKRKQGGKAKFILIPVAAILVIVAVVAGVLIWKSQSGNSVTDPAQNTEEVSLPTGSLGGLFETETEPVQTEAPETSAPVSETPEPVETPAQEETEESLDSDVWTPVTQTQTQTSQEPEQQQTGTTTTHTYDGVTISGDYVFPDSNSRYLSESELTSLTRQELDIARNEIFARNGYIFQSEAYQSYFEGCSWYTAKYEKADFDRLVTMNDYEKKNSELIRAYEVRLGYLNG
jgi:hypothetical protein